MRVKVLSEPSLPEITNTIGVGLDFFLAEDTALSWS